VAPIKWRCGRTDPNVISVMFALDAEFLAATAQCVLKWHIRHFSAC
jgi:hypothetical protein